MPFWDWYLNILLCLIAAAVLAIILGRLFLRLYTHFCIWLIYGPRRKL